MPRKNPKQVLEENKKAGSYAVPAEDREIFDYFTQRKNELQEARKNVVGVNIESVWRAADKAYVPHNLKQTGGTKALVSDDELGWRSTPVILGRSDDWQENSVPVNPYVKVQTALSILIDRNPTAVFKALSKRFEGSSELHSELYKRNWDVAESKQMLKTLVFNGAKYGLICGQTFPLKVEHDGRDIIGSKDGKNEYKDIKIKRYDDVYRVALDPWTSWFDDMAKPGDVFSLNDWMRRKDYSWETFIERFSHLPNFKYVLPKSVKVGSFEAETGQGPEAPEIKKKDVVRLWFYENLSRDVLFVQTDDGIVLINEPIPMSAKNKRLSGWAAPWTLRHHDTIIGIGVYEAMRNDYKLYLKVRNMTMDQLVLSIYKEWFYEGTSTLQNTGEMKIKPGSGRQVTNPRNIVWNEVPTPGAEAWKGLEFIKSEIDDATGISKTLEGELSPKAKAFDIAQAREASLRRLKMPLDNVSYALEQDAYISVALFQELYSIPEVEKVVDADLISKYRNEISSGELQAEDITEGSEEGVETLEVRRFREFPLNLERDADGNITQSKMEKFFTPRPDDLVWEGKISINAQSIIAESPLLEKQNKLELANLLVPLLVQPPQIVMPAVKQLLKTYNEKPEDWLPPAWLQAEAVGFAPPQEPLFVEGGASPRGETIQTEASKVVPVTEIRPGQGSAVGKFLGRLNPFSNFSNP